jgi:dephospho-CoA kinase
MKKRRNKNRVVIGLTGSFGTGKSTVAGMFRALGAGVVDADRVAHAAIRPGTGTWRSLVAEFGKEILKKNRVIDRKKLAARVFIDSNKVKKINAIVHPGVIGDIDAALAGSPKPVVVIDAPLLIEAGLCENVDILAVVKLDRRTQVARLRTKKHMSVEDIMRRLRAQMPLSKKIRMADFIIDNNGTVAQTKKQVKDIMEHLHGR